MKENICPRCAANLIEGYCEYCGWNRPRAIENKTIVLEGILSNLTVTYATCTFTPKVGSPVVINSKEISEIHLSQAPMIGTGELSVLTVTGMSQKITFLPTQNSKVNEVASYLLQTAPNAQYKNYPGTLQESDFYGVKCPKCNSKNTKPVSGATRNFSLWKLIVAGLLILAGIGGTSTNIGVAILCILGGLVLAAFGFGFIGKKKTNILCIDCRKKFTV